MRTLIRNGTVVTATEAIRADVLIEDERVALIGLSLDARADRVIDATDRYVMPGGVDVHTHFDLPFGGSFCSDDFATGTRAAAFGGTTTCVDFAVQDFGEPLRKGLDRWFEKGQKAQTDFGLHMIVREVNDGTLQEMDDLVNEGITSFKLFMAYPGVFMNDDASIFRAMQRAADSGALIMMHAENGGPIDVLVKQLLAEGKTDPKYHGQSRPAAMEGEAVHRAFKLAELAGAPAYIVHLSSRDALNAVREARGRGLPAYAETCPQYLYLSADDMGRPGFEGAHDGRISLSRFVELVATAPAKMFGLYPRKGTIAPGSDADIVVFDPNHERVLSAKTHHMNVDYSCFEGMKVKGLPRIVLQRGAVLVEDGEFHAKEGKGTFVPRSRLQAP